MKKFSMIFIALFACYIAQAQINKVAVVSFYCNAEVGTDFSGGLVADVRDLTGTDKKFDNKSEMMKFKDMLFGKMQKDLPFELASENMVLENESYNAFAPVYKEEGQIAPDGYKVFSNLKDKEAAELISYFEGVDAVMIVSLDYYLERNTMAANTGVGVAKGTAVLNLRVIDKDGKQIIKQRSTGVSKKSVKVAMNKVHKKAVDDVPEVISEAYEILLADVKKDLPKEINKMYKKLAKN